MEAKCHLTHKTKLCHDLGNLGVTQSHIHSPRVLCMLCAGISMKTPTQHSVANH